MTYESETLITTITLPVVSIEKAGEGIYQAEIFAITTVEDQTESEN